MAVPDNGFQGFQFGSVMEVELRGVTDAPQILGGNGEMFLHRVILSERVGRFRQLFRLPDRHIPYGRVIDILQFTGGPLRRSGAPG